MNKNEPKIKNHDSLTIELAEENQNDGSSIAEDFTPPPV
jgi:hypothetical protein